LIKSCGFREKDPFQQRISPDMKHSKSSFTVNQIGKCRF